MMPLAPWKYADKPVFAVVGVPLVGYNRQYVGSQPVSLRVRTVTEGIDVATRGGVGLQTRSSITRDDLIKTIRARSAPGKVVLFGKGSDP
jgi:hypothetical protein